MGRTRPRRGLALVLMAAIVAIQIPLPSRASGAVILSSADPAGSIYANLGGELVWVDLRSYRLSRAEVLDGSGSFSITLLRPATAPDLRFESEPSPGDVELLGSDAERVLAATGKDPRGVRVWNKLAVWTLQTTPGHVTSIVRAGADELVTRVPRPVLEGRPGETDIVEIGVNGWFVEVSPTDYYKLTRGIRHPEALEELASRFDDAPAFAAAFTGAGLVLDRMAQETQAGDSCLGVCFRCAASLVGWGVTLLSVWGSCIATVATAGAALIACIASLVGHQAANMVLVASCTDCATCTNPPPPGGTGDDGEPDGSDPGGTCAEGTHDCCNGQCCSDDHPPSTCE